MDWIRVDERLPEPGVWVLVYQYGRILNAQAASYRVNRLTGIPYWRAADDNLGDFVDVTHWMPMPEPPTDHPPAFWVRRDGYKELVIGETHPDDDVLSAHLSVEAAWKYTTQK